MNCESSSFGKLLLLTFLNGLRMSSICLDFQGLLHVLVLVIELLVDKMHLFEKKKTLILDY